MNESQEIAQDVRMRLVDAGGYAAQDLGFGRIAGQILVFLYLSDGERSLDQIEQELSISKAATSGATRQLEALGLLRRCWKQGDRKVYYRTADNLGEVFRDGLVSLMRRKIETIANELEQGESIIRHSNDSKNNELKFLISRIQRAKKLSNRAKKLIDSPWLRKFVR
jgi:DNA-binding transcriptional regulator GbsR (MarR family)